MKKDIRLLHFDPDTQNFIFSWNSKSGVLEGRDRLIQQITKRILTARGSNQFNRQFGENFYNLFRAIDYSKAQQIKEAFPVLVKNVEEDIIAEQSLEDNLRPEEKLESLDLLSIDLDERFGAWIIEIRVITEDGVVNKFSVI